jgi:hypothetical protein
MNKIINTFPKNTQEEVRTQLTEYRGHRLIDMRVWYKPGEGEDPRPTKKGLTLSVGLYPQLKKAIDELANELIRR